MHGQGTESEHASSMFVEKTVEPLRRRVRRAWNRAEVSHCPSRIQELHAGLLSASACHYTLTSGAKCMGKYKPHSRDDRNDNNGSSSCCSCSCCIDVAAAAVVVVGAVVVVIVVGAAGDAEQQQQQQQKQ